MFLDDGLVGNSSLESASVDAEAVKTGLCTLGFTLSSSRCNWQPCLVMSLICQRTSLYVTQSRVTKLNLKNLSQLFS